MYVIHKKTTTKNVLKLLRLVNIIKMFVLLKLNGDLLHTGHKELRNSIIYPKDVLIRQNVQ